MSDYHQIKRDCLREKKLFEDPEFLPEDGNLFFSRKPPRPFVWKRPHEICSNPEWITGGASRFDIDQGMLGDCWLLAAISSLTVYEQLFARVVDPDQSFTGPEYCGIFKFNLWQNGAWEEVFVDDLLPTYNGKLVFMHSPSKNEFWSALLEKAYAKLSGSYEALKGGQTNEAMVDFTGGVTETFNLHKAPADMIRIMLKAQARYSLMCCDIEAAPNEIESKLDNGLVKGHAYSVTGVKKVKAREIEVSLVRVRNPWGNEREWKGAWGDQSSEWGLLSESEKRDLGLTFDDDGEFWMSYEDFSKNFTRLAICNLGPDSMTDQGRKAWEGRNEQASWVRNCTAGGCRNFPNSFASNPQFMIKLEDPDDDEEEDDCTIIVALMQKNRRKAKERGQKSLTIGYAIYKLEEDPQATRMEKEFFLYNSSTARSDNFVNARENVGRHKLKPGHYVIVPSTFEPNEQGDFLLRLFSEKPAKTRPADEPMSYTKPAQHVTSEQETAMNAKFHDMFDKLAGADGEIDSFELQQLLSRALKQHCGTDGFQLESARSLISRSDVNFSGKIEFGEFKKLWMEVMNWAKVFKQYDQDNNGTFSSYELRSALAKLGFRCSNKLIDALSMRYANKKSTVDFQDFILIVARLTNLFATFEQHCGETTGRATLSMDDFFLSAIYS